MGLLFFRSTVLARGPCRAKSEYTASRRCRSLRRWDGRRLQNVPRRYRGVAQLLERRCAWLKASARRVPMIDLVLASLFFPLRHFLISGTPLRAILMNLLGERRYSLGY